MKHTITVRVNGREQQDQVDERQLGIAAVGALGERQGEAADGHQDALSTRWLGIVAVLTVVVLYTVSKRKWQRPRWPHVRLRNPQPGQDPPEDHPTWWQRVLRTVCFVLSAVWLLPLVALLMTSWKSRTEAATTAWWSDPAWFSFSSWSLDDDTRGAMLQTFLLALVTVATVLVLATLLSRAMTRMSSIGVICLLALLAAMALAPPQILSARLEEIFSWGPLTVASGWQRLVLVHVALTLPLAALIFHVTGSDWYAAMRVSVAERLNRASANKGAALSGTRASPGTRALTYGTTPLRVFWTDQPAYPAVALLVFLQVWNDFVVGLLVAPDTVPLTVHLYGETRQFTTNLGPVAAASSVAALVPLTALVVFGPKLVEGLAGRDRQP
jgi:alpha-glucoside transport system permease protein